MHSNADRDRHLFGDGPKRILCLDGGGVRGIVTVGMLESIEAKLRARQPNDSQAQFRLSDHYDLIVGTSTGAIIATLLALGQTVASVREMYLSLGPAVFGRARFLGQVVQSKFDHRIFERILRGNLGDRRLGSADLKTGLLVTWKRVDSGSTWILGNNPNAPGWHVDRDRCLRDLVRATTAAPSYFAPVKMSVGDGESGLFLDGAMSGLNNPSVATFLYVTSRECGLNWQVGADRMSMLSLGTGFVRPRHNAVRFQRAMPAEQALITLQGLIFESQLLAVATMQAFSEPSSPFYVNSSLREQTGTVIGGRALLQFERFDVPLQEDDIRNELGLSFSARQARAFQSMDNGDPQNLASLLSIGRTKGDSIRAESIV